MGPLVLLLLFYSANLCFAIECFSIGSYNVTNREGWVLSNGRSWADASITAWYLNAAIGYSVGFLNEEDYTHSKLSIVAWDYYTNDIADVLWQLDTRVGINSTLQLQKDGNLVLIDEKDQKIWESQTGNRSVKAVCLTNYGALHLVNNTMESGQSNETIFYDQNYEGSNESSIDQGTVWSSFKHPTNKMVCGQVLEPGLSLVNGNYSFKSEPTGAALYFKQQPYLTWNISGLSASTCYVVLCCDTVVATLQLRSDTENVSFDRGYLRTNWKDNCSATTNATNITQLTISRFSVTAASYVAVVTLEEDGVLTVGKLSVKSSILQGNQTCRLPNFCGPYGLCTTNSSCDCPLLNASYFKPVDSSHIASGCDLSKGYGETGDCQMKKQSRVDYFRNDFSTPDKESINEDKCYASCLKNATCRVAFYRNASKNCFLVDNVATLKATKDDGFSASFKICTAKKSSHVVLIASVSGGLCLLLLIIIVIYMKMRKGDEGEEDDDAVVNSCLSGSTLKRFSLKELKALTKIDEKLGNGAFGTVYKGIISTGTSVAVKYLNGSSQEAKDFCAELSVLSRVRHYNLVRLVGFCSNKITRALVYEYMENGSLDQWLMGCKPFILQWKTRMEIAIGSAKGLAYLHEDCEDIVLHLDVKPQNILLDPDFCPKVADFGLSRLMNRGENLVFTENICGTPGYWAPEVMTSQGINVKTDVYSFGVVLIEIFAGQKLLDPRMLSSMIKDDEAIYKCIDKRIGLFNLEEARRMLRVASLCIQLDPEDRPFMSSVVQMLEGKIDIPMFYQNISADTNLKFMKLLEARTSSSIRLNLASSSSDVSMRSQL